MDPTGLLARTLPEQEANVNQNAVYEPRAAMHFQDDPVVATAVFAEAGVEAMSSGKTFVYQAIDPAGATRIVDAYTALAPKLRPNTKPVDGVGFMPASRCFHFGEKDSGLPFSCIASADRYAIEAYSAQLLDVQQQVADQYRILLAG